MTIVAYPGLKSLSHPEAEGWDRGWHVLGLEMYMHDRVGCQVIAGSPGGISKSSINMWLGHEIAVEEDKDLHPANKYLMEWQAVPNTTQPCPMMKGFKKWISLRRYEHWDQHPTWAFIKGDSSSFQLKLDGSEGNRHETITPNDSSLDVPDIWWCGKQPSAQEHSRNSWTTRSKWPNPAC